MTTPTITSPPPAPPASPEAPPARAAADDPGPATTPAEVAASFYDAFLADDLIGASALLDPDVVLHVPGANPVAGDHEGLDAVLGWVLTSQAITREGTVDTRVVDLGGGATHATAICEVTGERPGRSVMHNRTIHVLRVDAGRIAEIWFHNWDQPSVDAFWS